MSYSRIHSIENNAVTADGNKVPLNKWIAEKVKDEPSDKASRAKKSVRFESSYEAGKSSSKGKNSAAKAAAPLAPKANTFAAHPRFVVDENDNVTVVPPRTNVFYEMGTVSGVVASAVKDLLSGVVDVAQKVVEFALKALRRLVAVPVSLVGSAVGAIFGLFSPKAEGQGAWAASGAKAGVTLTLNVEKALKAVVQYGLAVPLKAAAYGIGGAAYVAVLPVSIVASPVVAAVKNINR